MNHEDKIARQLARIDDMQRQSEKQIARAQERVTKRFERMRERLRKRFGELNSSQQRIIDAALELLKEDGLNNLSLRKLARMVDMQAPALYWHFKNKDVLVDYMAEGILQKEFHDLQPRQTDEPWQEWLIQHMLKLRKAMLAYPDGARVVAGAHLYPAVTLAQISETSLGSLLAAGFKPESARNITLTATHYTFGHVIEEQAAPTPEQLADFDIELFLQPFPNMRHIFEAAKAHGFKSDEDFVAGLQYIIRSAETELSAKNK